MDQVIKELLQKICKGKGILFTGSGFSSGATCVDGGAPPMAPELSKAICKLGNFDEDEDLKYTSDFFLDKNGSNLLIELLQKKYKLTKTSKAQQIVCGVEWKKFYTTNYDRSIEKAAEESNKVVTSVSLGINRNSFTASQKLCVHINGDIEFLTGESLNEDFKLSNKSYLSNNLLKNSTWGHILERDIGRTSAIVFIGNSLNSDIDLQQILFQNNQDIKDRTYFIISEDATDKDKYLLGKLGNVIPIGLERFSKLISKNKEMFNVDEHEFNVIKKYEISNSRGVLGVTDNEIGEFLMHGTIDQDLIDASQSEKQIIPYIVDRKEISFVHDNIENRVNTIILSDFGNGKSVFIAQLKAYLTLNSVNVYETINTEEDYVSDIDEIVKLNERIVLILDSYEKYIDIVFHCKQNNVNNIIFVLATRTIEHDYLCSKLEKIDFSYREVYLDHIDDSEIQEFISIINNLGWWNKHQIGKREQTSFIEDKNKREISGTLLSLLNSPNIQNKVNEIIKGLIAGSKNKDTVFAILFLNYLDIEAEFSLVSKVADNYEIYGSKLTRNSSFNELFQRNGLKLASKSSLFSLHVMKTYFKSEYISKYLLKVAKIFDADGKKSAIEDKIFKSVLRFSFVERIFPTKKINLRNYYEGLKKEVLWLKNDPHFWLQYGMAYITQNNYEEADTKIQNAYRIAKRKDNYHVRNIDLQYGRLLILKSTKELEPYTQYELFSRAHSLICNLDNDRYKFRQLSLYQKFFSSCYLGLSKGNKVNFEHACKNTLNSIQTDDSADNDGKFKVVNMFEGMIISMKESNERIKT